MIKVFKNFFSQYYLYFIFLIIVIIFEGFINLFATFSVIPLTEFILDQNLSNPSKITKIVLNTYAKINIDINFWSLGLTFVFFNFLKVFNFAIIRYLVLRIKYLITFGIYSDLVKNFLNADWLFFSKIDRGKFFNTFTKEMNVVGDTIGNITTQIANIFQLFLYIIVPLYINFKLTILIIFFVIIFILPFLYISKFSYFFGKKNLETANYLIQSVNEFIQGAKIILSYEKQGKIINDFKEKFKKHIYYTIRSQITNQALPQFFLPCAIFSVIVSIGYLASNNLNFSELSGVMWSLLAIIPIFLSLIKSKVSLSSFVPSYEQLMNLKKKAIINKRNNGKLELENITEGIKFENVSFSYDKKIILKNINTKFKINEISVIIGESGSGKSTLIDLISNITSTVSGKILIDKSDIKKINGSSLRKNIGYVTQDSFLFNTSIKNNLLWSNENANSDDIDLALKESYSKDFVNNFPHQMNTEVGDRGGLLSGGERQRIAIARALIRKPKILLLDEPTSSLDTISEKYIINCIKNIAKNTTVIISTHKLSILESSNKIIVMENGEIVEEGEYNYLLKNQKSHLNKMIFKKEIK